MNYRPLYNLLRPALLGLAFACTAPVLADSAPQATDHPRHQGERQALDHIEARIEAFRERVEGLAAEFDLTEAQRDEIRAIVQNAAAQIPPVALAMAANHRELVELAASEAFDRATAEAIAADQGDRFADLARIRADAFISIRELLSDDQLGMLTELRATVRNSAGGFLERAAPRRGDRRAALRSRGDRLAVLAAGVGVTPEQRAEVRAIVEDSVPALLDIAADMAANRRALSEAIRATVADPGEIDARIAAQGQLFGELVLVVFDTRVEARTVLSDEQLALLDDLRASLRARLAGVYGAF